MKTIRILILEDDLLTLSKLLSGLSSLEEEVAEKSNVDFSIVVLSEYTQVEKYINKDPSPEFDIILLDRDCKVGGSFHTLDINKFGVDKIISISSVPEYNQQMEKAGVTKIVHKDYQRLDIFAEKVMQEIQSFF